MNNTLPQPSVLAALLLASSLLVPAAQAAPSVAVDLAATAALLDAQQFRQAQPALRRLLALAQPDAAQRALIYDWLFAVDDLAEVERRTQRGLAAAEPAAVDLLAAGRLALNAREFAPARQHFEQAQTRARDARERGQALRGLGQIAYQQRDYERSLPLLEAAREQEASPDTLMALADTLIRLGRTNDAVAASEEAVRRNPFHEVANYQLGNGYTRANYTELQARCGAELAHAARLTRRASDAFEAGRLAQARGDARAALAACPGYGRAHAVLAKTVEGERMRVDVHRAEDERRFAATPMPQVPGIERYVLNWKDLTPRHRKRVALSVEPWKAYVPILVAGGAHHFIKPMWMRLSETPGAKSLRDARIDYDSRLWDDVRGMGGHMTVTGIEDVERSIYGRYNTVLHELTHQVHGVMTSAQKREIQALYSQAKERDARSGQAFLSRYAGGSIWEYFAEGANAQSSPRRDRHDHKEIARERLAALDPALQALVLREFARRDVAASLPVALVNDAQRHQENGELDRALAQLQQALRRAPDDEQVLAAALYGLALKGEPAPVQALARQALQRHPDSASLRVAAVSAQWHSGQPLAALLPLLEPDAAQTLASDERFELDMARAGYALHQGRTEAALAAYEAALAYQADSPEALWGRAATLALAGRWDTAFAVYGQVLKLRTGLIALRLDLARDLLLAGRVEPARAQLAEARTLNPTEPQLLAMEGWLALVDGQPGQALARADEALRRGPWCDTALIVRAAALRRQGQADAAAQALAPLRGRLAGDAGPRYVYRADISGWDSVRRDSAVLKRVLGALDTPS